MYPWRRRVQKLIVHEVEGEFVLLDGETDRIHQLNPTASAIWRKLEEARNAEDIAQGLVDEYDVEWEVALKDVRDTLDQLERLSLIVDSSGSAEAEQAEGNGLSAGR